MAELTGVAVALGLAAAGFGVPLPLHLARQGHKRRKDASLSGLVASSKDEGELVTLVVVHAHSVNLGPEMAGKQLALRTVYGKHRASGEARRVELVRDAAAKYVARDRGQAWAEANFEEACGFMEEPRTLPVRIELRDEWRRVLGFAEVTLPSERGSMERMSVQLQTGGPGTRAVGQLSVTVATRAVHLGELRQHWSSKVCELQGQAVLRSKVPLHVGCVRQQEDEE
eukprot:CAMPEP_0195057020 /NCGR_PEP_ID=MMETSP0448-20130528/5245_1 /TAXON_ID=66468 /ORGANISM="Heterocapsa triquestra, Strain CCMP 448" /LENGTH=226 /DNA_ID=CAMNT_0040086937 /DNA_START=56 /DNA_END=733 /DNA_ORIENTATION=+